MSLRYLGGVIKPSYNPLAANVTVSPTVVQTGGVYTLQQQAQAQGQQQWSHDPYFNNTTLLLHADNFANGSQNNTFLVTPPGGVGSYSGSFNGSTQYLTVPSNSVFDFGSGNFTVEAWIYITTSTANFKQIYGKFSGNIAPVSFGVDGSNNVSYYLSSNGTSYDIAVGVTGGVVVLNTWNHVALVRNGSTFTPYLNGVAGTTTTSSATLASNSSVVSIGAATAAAVVNYFPGYISNIRVVKGTAVYTANFTPPTSPLTAITNTSLLTCQSATFVDNSTNNFTITNVGTATIVNPNSFPAITRNGTPTQGTFTPHGNVWSNYFNGSTDYFTVPSNAAFSFGTGDFTVECWVNIPAISVTNGKVVVDSRPTSTNGSYWIFAFGPTGIMAFTTMTTGGTTISATQAYPNQWVHYAATRQSGTLRLWVNGQLIATATGNTDNIQSSGLRIGANAFASIAPDTYMLGYISNLRIVKGTAVYTSTFTPPNAPLTAITNTSLLTCQSNQFIDNSTNAFAITANGTPSVQRFAPFSPSSGYSPSVYSGSVYLGSANYLSVPASSVFDLGSGNFTLEFWAYVTDFSAWQPVACWGTGSWKNIRISNTAAYVESPGTSTQLSASFPITLATNAWYHIALVRTSTTTMTAYVNGVAGTAQTGMSASFTVGNSTDTFSIGYKSDPQYFIGYICDYRLLKGTAQYTANFTPPSAPLAYIANTSLLLSYTNAGIYDNGMQNNLTTVGNAQVSTSIVKYGSGSMYFDGNGDYVSAILSQTVMLGTGAFTLECWFYIAANSTANVDGNRIAALATTQRFSSQTGFELFVDGNSTTTGTGLVFANWVSGSRYAVSATVTVAQGTWHHVAVVRSGTTTTIYFNGVSVASGTLGNQTINPIDNLWVGANNNSNYYHYLNGYIDDIRLTKGVARYLSNFTPPQVAMANQ